MENQLLQRHIFKVNINFKDNIQVNAIYFAIASGYFNIVKYLVEKGAEVNIQDIHGISPLMIASIKGYKEIVDLLS